MARPLGTFCGCRRYCGDLPEEQCHPLAICKDLPRAPEPPLVEIVMVPRRLAGESPSTGSSE